MPVPPCERGVRVEVESEVGFTVRQQSGIGSQGIVQQRLKLGPTPNRNHWHRYGSGLGSCAVVRWGAAPRHRPVSSAELVTQITSKPVRQPVRPSLPPPRMHPLSAPPSRVLAVFCALMVGVFVTSTRAQAQNPPPPILDTVRAFTCPLGCDTVRGMVFDSLALQPLVGAIVVARPGGITVTTNEAGQFMLVHDGPAAQLTAYHAELDQIGIGALVAERPRGAATWRDVRMATPSYLSVWPRLCEGKRPVVARPVILMGTARLADGVTRVSGAKIMVQWPPSPYSAGSGGLRSAETITDSIGNYVVCGVEEFVEPSLWAVSAEAQSGVITVPADMRPVRRVDLVLGRTGSQAATTHVRGRVIDETSAPIVGMRLRLDGVEGDAVTGSDGAFSFDGVPVGSRMLTARAIGYTPIGQVVEVLQGRDAPLTIPMQKVVVLEGVTTKALIRRDRAEYDMRRRTGWGVYVDSTAIANAPFLRFALTPVRGITVRGPGPNGRREGQATDFVITGIRGCQAQIWLDGRRSDLREVNDLFKQDVVSIEVYPSAEFAPSQFVTPPSQCAVVLFWTKHGLRP